jgi:hypothetical protein
MGRLRREALQTIDQSQALIAKADDKLDDAGDLMDLGKMILLRLDRILEVLEEKGVDINPKVGNTEFPVGVNVSISKEGE